jgi:hypothetical protein
MSEVKEKEDKNDYTGTVIKVMPVQTGSGAKGTWNKQGFAIETNDQYPKKIYFELWGDKVERCPKVGDVVTVGYNAESREYNERWYTDLRAWKVEGEKKTPLSKEQKDNVKKAVDNFGLAQTNEDDDLPF